MAFGGSSSAYAPRLDPARFFAPEHDTQTCARPTAR